MMPDFAILVEMRFLHIADVHLGCTRYGLDESPRDFFYAWSDVLERYAIGENVDFVLICGDFFHKRSVPPETMDHAVEGLSRLRDHDIPVIAIEGNHDQKHGDTPFSWLRSLEKWKLLHLLEPNVRTGELRYEPWDYERDDPVRGGFIDIGRARIFGSAWYGSQAGAAIPKMVEAISECRREGAFHILMLHTDIEGYQKHPVPALPMGSLTELRDVVDYVALGHTHMHYEIDNWAFNPGSIEVTNISEFRETRGAFVVDVGEDNSVSATHVTEYLHRPFQRLVFEVDRYDEPAELLAEAVKFVGANARGPEPGLPAPILEVTLRGSLGFPNSALDLRKFRDEAQRICGAFHVRVRNMTIPVELSADHEIETDISRERLERSIVEGLVHRDKRFRPIMSELAAAVVYTKEQALLGEEPEKIAEAIAGRIFARDTAAVE